MGLSRRVNYPYFYIRLSCPRFPVFAESISLLGRSNPHLLRNTFDKRSSNHFIASTSRRPSLPLPEKLTPHYQQQVEQSTSHFPALPSNVFIHGSKDPQGRERSFPGDHPAARWSSPSSAVTTWRRRSRGRCRVRHLTPLCFGGRSVNRLVPGFSTPNSTTVVSRGREKSFTKEGGTKGEREKKERETQTEKQANPPELGGRGRARAPVTSRSNAAFATPRGRDSSSLATDEGCCTKSLRQPRARAQNPYSPARSWHPRSVSHPSSLSLSLSRLHGRKTGPVLSFLSSSIPRPSCYSRYSPSSSPSITTRGASCTILSLFLVPSIVFPSRLTEFPLFPRDSSSKEGEGAVRLFSVRFHPSFPPRFLS